MAIGALLTAGGISAVMAGAAASTMGLALMGAAALLIGAVVVGPLAVRPAAAVTRLLPRRDVTARLSRENALRNPRRTAATAAALMLGVTVVASFTVLGSSLKASASRGVERTLLADVVIDQGGYGGRSGAGGLAPELAAAAGRVPGVSAVDGVGGGSADIAGDTKQVGVIDPTTIDRVLDLGVRSGALADLRPGTLAVSSDVASKHRWHIGDTLPITYPDGMSGRVRIVAILNHPDLTGDYVLPRAGWTPHVRQSFYARILLDVSPGADVSAVQHQVTQLAAAYGAPRVQDQAQFRSSQTSGVNTMLGLVYVMLLLAIVIAVMGIANTMGLAVHERRRELGLLRTLGQTQGQARAMIRWESVIVALLGTVTGIALGSFLGWAFVAAASGSALAVFSLPVPQLGIVLVLGGLAGVVAAIRPARRATRLDVLSALAST
jgi:putative ABC transport system permease protein